MKLIQGAAVAALLFASPAFAQDTTASTESVPPAASQCGQLPAAPTMPDGANANRRVMTAANTEITSWVAASEAHLACVRAEMNAAASTYEARRTEHNSRLEQVRAFIASWTAETEEFNAR